MLNVNRCSHVAFPGETVMAEEKLCTERYLWNALEDVDLWMSIIAGGFSQNGYGEEALMLFREMQL
jgi:pentatricopeptide repeat protein